MVPIDSDLIFVNCILLFLNGQPLTIRLVTCTSTSKDPVGAAAGHRSNEYIYFVLRISINIHKQLLSIYQHNSSVEQNNCCII